ncbi:MAG: hypothetical protein IKV55_02690 [Oscillospiraceae bacterium]|nr:hypothetical protein [Oscillospiraceae bacterium]
MHHHHGFGHGPHFPHHHHHCAPNLFFTPHMPHFRIRPHHFHPTHYHGGCSGCGCLPFLLLLLFFFF